MGLDNKEQPLEVNRAVEDECLPAYTSQAGGQVEAPAYDYTDKSGRRSSSSSAEDSCRKPGKIPGAINSYWQTKMTRTFHLGERRDVPLFAVKTSSGWSRKHPELTIYDGLDSGDGMPMLAGATRASMWSRKYDMSLPPLAGSGSTERTIETLAVATSMTRVVYSFGIEVPTGPSGQLRREEFEWRSTRADEVRGMGSRWVRGWKLVRQSSEAFRGPGGERHARDEGTTSDGKEVVAVWAHNQSWSMTKAFKFRFLGSALAGDLGDRFDIMALITALNMWHQETKANAAVASGAAA